MTPLGQAAPRGLRRFNQTQCGQCSAPAYPADHVRGASVPGKHERWAQHFYCRRCDAHFTLDVTFADLVQFTLL